MLKTECFGYYYYSFQILIFWPSNYHIPEWSITLCLACRMLLQVKPGLYHNDVWRKLFLENYLPLKHVLNKISSFCKIRQPCLASKIELCYSYPHITYSKQFNVLFIHLVCITIKIYKSCFQCGRKSYPEALKNSWHK